MYVKRIALLFLTSITAISTTTTATGEEIARVRVTSPATVIVERTDGKIRIIVETESPGAPTPEPPRPNPTPQDPNGLKSKIADILSTLSNEESLAVLDGFRKGLEAAKPVLDRGKSVLKEDEAVNWIRLETLNQIRVPKSQGMLAAVQEFSALILELDGDYVSRVAELRKAL